jgi:hypothetical protein
MANPNIVSVTTINGGTAYQSLTNTNDNSLISNAASSGKVLKINNIFVSNINGVSAATITLSYRSAANAVTDGTLATASSGTAYRIAYQISVPPNASVILVDKTTAFYVGEAQSVVVTGGTASAIELTASYENITDT